MFFKLSADIKFMPINLDFGPDLGILCRRSGKSQYKAFLRFFEQGQGIRPEIRRKHAQRFMLPPNLKKAINFPHFDV